jgi:hypothetical protein
MPDIFIPIDTTRISGYYNSVIRKGIINEYIQKYSETHREKLKKDYPTIESFVKNFTVDEAFMKDFVEFAAKEGVRKNDTANADIIKTFNEFTTSKGIKKTATVDEALMKSFMDYANKESIRKNDEDFSKSEKYIKNLLKARLAQYIWDFAAFWEVYNETDDVYNRALQVIQDKNKFKELKVND